MRMTFLGSGTSYGVPVLGCDCPVCRSTDARDRRYRTSLLVESGVASLVVDATPEFRLQGLRSGLKRLDALLLTHAHADHIHGLDDVRPLTHDRILPVYGNRACLDEVGERFPYIFRSSQVGGGKPRIELIEAPQRSIQLAGITVTALPLMHGELPILGWRFGDFAWLTDCSAIPPATLRLLEGTRIVAIDGLRRNPHPTHFSIGQAIEAARSIGAKETWIIHITHDHSHVALEELCHELGADVGARPAWDGLVVSS
ncbi:MAG: MBL fold metallo-hydrolase [Spirochaetota bacterium]